MQDAGSSRTYLGRIGCPKCDAVYRLGDLPSRGQKAACARCGHTLIERVSRTAAPLLALSTAVLVLILSAAMFPFLSINASGLSNRVSLLDIATSFGAGLLTLVSVWTVLFIVALPALRALLILYVLGPLEIGLAPLPHAKRAFRLAQSLKAWSMVEIFALGCAVALVKVAGLAQLEFGPAFWMFIVLAVLTLLMEGYTCTWSIWRALNRPEPSA